VRGNEARHALFGSLRVHSLPPEFYREAHKRAYFEPMPGTLRLFERFNEPVKKIVAQWWARIETSAKFAANLSDLRKYHATLRPGDVTLVGLIAEGGQGLATANNARFLAFLEGTPQARRLAEKAAECHSTWLADDRIRETFKQRLYHHGGDPARPPERQRAAWEAAVHDLRGEFSAVQLGFSKMDLFRIAPRALIADESDFRFAFETRRRHLLKHWQEEPQLADLWRQGSLEVDLKKLAKTAAKDDAAFCELCGHVQGWIKIRNEELRARNEPMLLKGVLGLRSSESYDDPDDVNRIATIYAGLAGKAIFVPFRKGDPTGNRWLDNE
jgi:hypothetical protein